MVDGQQVGLIKENVKAILLLKYPEIFCFRDFYDSKKVCVSIRNVNDIYLFLFCEV